MQVLGEMYQTLLLTGLIMSNPTSVWKHLTANVTSQRGLGKTVGLSLSILWLSNDAQWHKALMIYRRSRRIQIFWPPSENEHDLGFVKLAARYMLFTGELTPLIT